MLDDFIKIWDGGRNNEIIFSLHKRIFRN
jgi:hypothetical protein